MDLGIIYSSFLYPHHLFTMNCASVYDTSVTASLNTRSTFSYDIFKEYFLLSWNFWEKFYVFTGKPCGTSLAPIHKQRDDLFLGDHLSLSKHFLCTTNKLLIIKLQESPNKLILKVVATEKCQFTKKTPETAEGG